MSLDYKLANIFGTLYKQGNLLFTKDGTKLLSPVGSRVSCFDLVNNKSFTFAYDHRKNISRIALNPQETLLISVDDDGRAILVNFVRRTVLHHFNLKNKVFDLQFSPDGTHFAVGLANEVQIWKTPSKNNERQFQPFVRHKVCPGHYSDVTSVVWSHDSRFVISTSVDMTMRVHFLNSEDASASAMLGGHRDAILGAFFSEDQEAIYSLSRDGAFFEWRYLEYEDEDMSDIDETNQQTANSNSNDIEIDENEDNESDSEDESESESEGESEDDSDSDSTTATSVTNSEPSGKWVIVRKSFFMQDRVKSCAFHAASNLLVVGFESGVFVLYEVAPFNFDEPETGAESAQSSTPGVNELQRLSISQSSIDVVSINSTGEWLAFGSSAQGQLFVWEWQSESYILKQQGHHDVLNCIAYSQDGSKIATGSDDGKIKIWDSVSGLCVVTLTAHVSAVTALVFGTRGNVLFSASLDGSVRAWDLLRYRNFRTFTAPERAQFTSLAVDPSSELVCAASRDEFTIHVWNVQSAQHLEALSAHSAPISKLVWSPDGKYLISGSWDATVRLWNLYASSAARSEALELASDVLCVAVRPDSKEIAVSTMDGQISFWDTESSKQLASVDAREDIAGGRYRSDKFTAQNAARSRYVTCLSYSADGQRVLAGGNSRHILLYDVSNEVLLRKMTVSRNLALDGVQDYLNSKNMTEFGPKDDFMGSDDESEDETLPGAQKGDLSARKKRREVRNSDLQFSPTAASFAVASSEGLIVFSIDTFDAFDAFDLDVDVTIDSTIRTLTVDKDYLVALVMAFRLGEQNLVRRVYESVPVSDINMVVRGLPSIYVGRLMRTIASLANTYDSPHFEFNLLWVKAIATYHGRYISQERHETSSHLRGLQRFVGNINKDYNKLANQNVSMIQYLLKQDISTSFSKMKINGTDRTAPNVDIMGHVEDENDSDDLDDEGWFGPESKVDDIKARVEFEVDDEE